MIHVGEIADALVVGARVLILEEAGGMPRPDPGDGGGGFNARILPGILIGGFF
jgi:hypothetical protein